MGGGSGGLGDENKPPMIVSSFQGVIGAMSPFCSFAHAKIPPNPGLDGMWTH
jgi:hypothetical protein